MGEVLHNDPLAPGLADLSAVQRTIAFARFRQIGELQKRLRKLHGTAGTIANLTAFNDLSQTVHDLHRDHTKAREWC